MTVTELRIEIGYGMSRSGSSVSAHCVGGKRDTHEIRGGESCHDTDVAVSHGVAFMC